MIDIFSSKDSAFHEQRAEEEAAAAARAFNPLARTAHLELSARHLKAARRGYQVHEDMRTLLDRR